jgi:hypothetical protein
MLAVANLEILHLNIRTLTFLNRQHLRRMDAQKLLSVEMSKITLQSVQDPKTDQMSERWSRANNLKQRNDKHLKQDQDRDF